MGYSGGAKENPTYYNLGDHSETIQIDFDPSRISYAEMLDIFWELHQPEFPSISNQYKSVIFYHSEEQKRLAMETKEREEEKRGRIYTEIVPFQEFWLAENYHQKWMLQQMPQLKKEFEEIYPDPADFVNSTAASRANGYAGGDGTLEQFQKEVDSIGLSPEADELLLGIVKRWGTGKACQL